jgi:diguanylate cyclase (GGDEF)-like protein
MFASARSGAHGEGTIWAALRQGAADRIRHTHVDPLDSQHGYIGHYVSIRSEEAITERTKKQAKSLNQLLGQSEQINELMKHSAEELSSFIMSIKQELANRDPLPGVEIALEKSAAVENELRDASEKLTAVNQALMDEVRERTMIDHQLAAALEQEEAARNAAFRDILTGLPNRALFNDRLEHGIAQATRHHWTLAVMFLDLDKFKSVNDSYGHHAGDTVLQTIAKRLKDNSRDEDTISRHGGDEFLYLLTQIREHKDIAMIAGKILNAIQAPCNVSVRDLIIHPSIEASIGISIFPKDGATAEALIRSADEAMFMAKKNKSGYAFAQ